MSDNIYIKTKNEPSTNSINSNFNFSNEKLIINTASKLAEIEQEYDDIFIVQNY